MAAYVSSWSPLSVEKIFKDYCALVRALVYDVDEFYALCDPEKENLCLYGHANESWEVALPAEEVRKNVQNNPNKKISLDRVYK